MEVKGKLSAYQQLSLQVNKAYILRQIKILPILELDEYDNKTPAVLECYEILKDSAQAIQNYLGIRLSFTKGRTKCVNQIFAALGVNVESISRKGSRGDRSRQYKATLSKTQNALIEGYGRKIRQDAELLKNPENRVPESSVPPCPVNQNNQSSIYKLVDTHRNTIKSGHEKIPDPDSLPEEI